MGGIKEGEGKSEERNLAKGRRLGAITSVGVREGRGGEENNRKGEGEERRRGHFSR